MMERAFKVSGSGPDPGRRNYCSSHDSSSSSGSVLGVKYETTTYLGLAGSQMSPVPGQGSAVKAGSTLILRLDTVTTLIVKPREARMFSQPFALFLSSRKPDHAASGMGTGYCCRPHRAAYAGSGTVQNLHGTLAQVETSRSRRLGSAPRELAGLQRPYPMHLAIAHSEQRLRA